MRMCTCRLVPRLVENNARDKRTERGGAQYPDVVLLLLEQVKRVAVLLHVLLDLEQLVVKLVERDLRRVFAVALELFLLRHKLLERAQDAQHVVASADIRDEEPLERALVRIFVLELDAALAFVELGQAFEGVKRYRLVAVEAEEVATVLM